jgi:hypothetical protein
MVSRQERGRRIRKADEMIAALEAAYEAAATGGATSVSFDGQSTTWDLAKLHSELSRWRKERDRLENGGRRTATVRLDNAG